MRDCADMVRGRGVWRDAFAVVEEDAKEAAMSKARPAGFEPATCRLGTGCSILLSYERYAVARLLSGRSLVNEAYSILADQSIGVQFSFN